MAHYLTITASSAIGQEIVRELTLQGDTVFTTARDKTKIQADALLDATDFDDAQSVDSHAQFRMHRYCT